MQTLVCLLAAMLALGAAGLSLPAASAQPPAPDPRFGMVETYVNPEAAGMAGVGYTRVILRWDVIQPAAAVDWKPANVPDPLIAAELAAGREVAGLIIGTPAWARADPEDPSGARAVPDMFHWQAFVRRMAQHYQGRIRHWIIWNEPDVWMLDHPGNTWTGSEEDYYRLLKTAYLAIKDVDPSLQVYVAGLTYFWDWEHGRRRYLDRMLEVIARDPDAPENHYYFDGVTYHLYFNPLQTKEVLDETWDTLGRYNITGKQVWINETNAPPSDDPQEPPWSTPRFEVSLQDQAAFVIQQYALAFSAGANRVEVYKLRNTADHPESIEPFGLLRADDTPRPAFAAYQAVTSYLRDFQRAYAERQGNVLAVTFERGDQTTTVLWTLGSAPAQVRVRAITAQAQLVDQQGQATFADAVDGEYVIDLPAAPCTQPSSTLAGNASCLIGGAPRLLVENGPAGGRTALALPAPPTATATSTVEPSPTPTRVPLLTTTVASVASATPTFTATFTPVPTPTFTPSSAPTASPARLAALPTTSPPATILPLTARPEDEAQSDLGMPLAIPLTLSLLAILAGLRLSRGRR